MNIFKRVYNKILRETKRSLKLDSEYLQLIKQEKYRVQLLNQLGIDLVLDIGANLGQYTKALFAHGFAGNVISFEPVSDVYSKLLIKSKSLKNWTIYERCAVGEQAGETEINVSENYESSS